METLTGKIGPLKVWQWGGVVILGAAGFMWWRRRGAASSSTAGDTGNLNSGPDTSANIPDYSTGYDSGYAAGLNATGDAGSAGASSGSGGTVSGSGDGSGSTGTGGTGGTGGGTGGSGSGGSTGGSGQGGGGGTSGGTVAPVSHARFCAMTKDPAGHMVQACGFGNWIKTTTGWTFQPGIPQAPTATPGTTPAHPTIVSGPNAGQVGTPTPTHVIPPPTGPVRLTTTIPQGTGTLRLQPLATRGAQLAYAAA